jgi:DNA-binding LacI/PurR family transcriptional regulator
VTIENFEASRRLVSHLIGLGHRRIAYIGDRFGYSSDSERFSGYRSALDGADVPFEPGLVAHGNGKVEGGTEAMTSLLDMTDLPTAVFCYNDMTAIGAMRAIRGLGLSVPTDISLAGFDDLPIASLVEPALTTVRQPTHRMGRLAMQVLLRLMTGEQADQNVGVTGDVIVRQSTAPPRGTACSYSYDPTTAGREKTTNSSTSRSKIAG